MPNLWAESPVSQLSEAIEIEALFRWGDICFEGTEELCRSTGPN